MRSTRRGSGLIARAFAYIPEGRSDLWVAMLMPEESRGSGTAGKKRKTDK